jgi:hypothetical protein
LVQVWLVQSRPVAGRKPKNFNLGNYALVETAPFQTGGAVFIKVRQCCKQLTGLAGSGQTGDNRATAIRSLAFFDRRVTGKRQFPSKMEQHEAFGAYFRPALFDQSLQHSEIVLG